MRVSGVGSEVDAILRARYLPTISCSKKAMAGGSGDSRATGDASISRRFFL
jgi:hypothetical protein